MGRNPVVDKTEEYRDFIPEGYKSVLLISADFELAWAWRYSKGKKNSHDFVQEKAQLARKNVPAILELCDQYQIPITWATVGHLLLDRCSQNGNKKHPEILNVPTYEGPFWDFNGRDWFEHDPCTDFQTDPDWYAPDLVEMILNSRVEHEIGSHTFSHIDCRDSVCSPELFRSELQSCKKAAEKFELDLTSFVHPGHTIGNLDALVEEGFTNFRTNDRNVLGYPKKHNNGIWELEQTNEFSFRKEWSVAYHIHRYKEIIRRAMRSNTVCVSWFHPSFDPIMLDEIWKPVFEYVHQNRNNIWVTTHQQYMNFLEDRKVVGEE